MSDKEIIILTDGDSIRDEFGIEYVIREIENGKVYLELADQYVGTAVKTRKIEDMKELIRSDIWSVASDE